jgi:hypothetical protein
VIRTEIEERVALQVLSSTSRPDCEQNRSRVLTSVIKETGRSHGP